MENASEALTMAGAVLIFILALTVCMSSFSIMKEGVDRIERQTEVVKLATNSNEYINFVNSRNGGAIRTVYADTVVTSLYRSLKENYIVYIKLKDYDKNIIEIKSGVKEHKATRDVYSVTSSGNKKIISNGDSLIKVTIGKNEKINELLYKGLYERLENRSFYEYLGEYQDNTEANSEDKLIKRVITYIEL